MYCVVCMYYTALYFNVYEIYWMVFSFSLCCSLSYCVKLNCSVSHCFVLSLLCALHCVVLFHAVSYWIKLWWDTKSYHWHWAHYLFVSSPQQCNVWLLSYGWLEDSRALLSAICELLPGLIRTSAVFYCALLCCIDFVKHCIYIVIKIGWMHVNLLCLYLRFHCLGSSSLAVPYVHYIA